MQSVHLLPTARTSERVTVANSIMRVQVRAVFIASSAIPNHITADTFVRSEGFPLPARILKQVTRDILKQVMHNVLIQVMHNDIKQFTLTILKQFTLILQNKLCIVF